MSDTAPLLFHPKLGMLAPANAAANEAMRAIEGDVRVEIKRTRGNVKRNALYWSVLNICAPMLEEKAPGLNVDLLHKVLKDKYGLVRVVKLPSGQEVRDYESTSFAKMTEPERAKFIDWSLSTLSSWLGVNVQTLRNEGEAA